MQEKHGAVERSPSPDARVISPATAVGTDLEHALTSPTPAPPRSSTPFSLGKRIPLSFSRRASRAPTIISCSSPINRSDLVASAERIFLRYLSPSIQLTTRTGREVVSPLCPSPWCRCISCVQRAGSSGYLASFLVMKSSTLIIVAGASVSV